jgi:hypothetical protein
MTSPSGRRIGIPSLQTRPAVWVVLIVLMFIALSITTSFQLPLFEGFDETAHYRVVDDYARHAALPDLTHAPSHEAHQPPLYYAIGALLIAPIDRSDFDAVFQINPGSAVNVRQNVAAPDPLRFTGAALALRLLRLFSTVLGTLTVLLTYALARQLQLSAPFSLLAAALLAFNPKFIMLSAAVSNDIAAICAATACLALCARFMRRPPTAGGAFVLGASVGVAALGKNSGLGLGLPVLFALVYAAAAQTRRRRIPRDILYYGTIAALGGLLVVGWLFIVQWVRYGSPLAWEQVNMLNRFSLRNAPLDLGQFVAMLPPILSTLWRVNQALPLQAAGDVLMTLVLLIAATGWVLGILRRHLPGTIGLLPIAMLGSLIALLPWMRLYGGTEDARLLPTVFPSVAVLCAVGIAMATARFRALGGWLAPLIAGVSLIWAGIAPFALLAPAFPAQQPLPADAFIYQLPAAERDRLPKLPVALFENGIELAQAVVASDRLASGEGVGLVLTWRVTRPVMRPYVLTLEAFAVQGQSLGKLDTTPLGGRRPTGVWQVGDVYREAYTLTLASVATDAPVIATIYAGWHESDPPYTVSGVVGSKGLTAPLGRVKLRAMQSPPAPQQPVDVVFGGVIALDGYDTQSGTITLHWRAVSHVPLDYQVFVHIIDAQGKAAGQADGPLPLRAALWDQGEVVLDQHQVAGLGKGGSVLVGVYDLNTNARLPAVRADGSRWPDDSAELRSDR